jgi:hypothetical protein
MTTSSRQSALQRVGRVLLGVGGVVGVAAAGAWAFDWLPPMPEWMVRVAMFKLALIASGGLLAAGAMLGRRARAQSDADASRGTDASPAELSAGPATELDPSRRAGEREPVHGRPPGDTTPRQHR